MSSPYPDQLVQHFGRDGLRRFGRGSTQGARLPEVSRTLLEETGVPRSVAPYFPPLTFVLWTKKRCAYVMCNRCIVNLVWLTGAATGWLRQSDRHSTVQCHVEL